MIGTCPNIFPEPLTPSQEHMQGGKVHVVHAADMSASRPLPLTSKSRPCHHDRYFIFHMSNHDQYHKIVLQCRKYINIYDICINIWLILFNKDNIFKLEQSIISEWQKTKLWQSLFRSPCVSIMSNVGWRYGSVIWTKICWNNKCNTICSCYGCVIY